MVSIRDKYGQVHLVRLPISSPLTSDTGNRADQRHRSRPAPGCGGPQHPST